MPAHSPNRNPTDEAFSRTQTLLTKAAVRTKEMLIEATAEASSTVTLEDAQG